MCQSQNSKHRTNLVVTTTIINFFFFIQPMVKITHNPKICGGKACIEGTRIRVIDIIERYKILNESPEEIAEGFAIDIDAVFAAISYYYKHTAEIKNEIDKDKAFVEKMRKELVH